MQGLWIPVCDMLISSFTHQSNNSISKKHTLCPRTLQSNKTRYKCNDEDSRIEGSIIEPKDPRSGIKKGFPIWGDASES